MIPITKDSLLTIVAPDAPLYLTDDKKYFYIRWVSVRNNRTGEFVAKYISFDIDEINRLSNTLRKTLGADHIIYSDGMWFDVPKYQIDDIRDLLFLCRITTDETRKKIRNVEIMSKVINGVGDYIEYFKKPNPYKYKYYALMRGAVE